MKDEDRAQNPAPVSDFNRTANDAMPEDPFVCERCGDPLGHGYRFCSRTCYEESRREGPLPEMTLEEMKAEMERVFARLRTYPEDTP